MDTPHTLGRQSRKRQSDDELLQLLCNSDTDTWRQRDETLDASSRPSRILDKTVAEFVHPVSHIHYLWGVVLSGKCNANDSELNVFHVCTLTPTSKLLDTISILEAEVSKATSAREKSRDLATGCLVMSDAWNFELAVLIICIYQCLEASPGFFFFFSLAASAYSLITSKPKRVIHFTFPFFSQTSLRSATPNKS